MLKISTQNFIIEVNFFNHFIERYQVIKIPLVSSDGKHVKGERKDDVKNWEVVKRRKRPKPNKNIQKETMKRRIEVDYKL